MHFFTRFTVKDPPVSESNKEQILFSKEQLSGVFIREAPRSFSRHTYALSSGIIVRSFYKES